MLFKIDSASATDQNTVVSLRCPGCRQQGTFDRVIPNDALINVVVDAAGTSHQYVFGHRKCPNPQCSTHIFFAYSNNMRKLVLSYPAERIDFDSTNIPQPVLAALEEAITCHSNACFAAAAIMVRKTLEALCNDRKVTGPNLRARLQGLGATVVLPKELLDALDDVRLLGNDAAHIESQAYNQVGQAEVELVVEVAKEVLKAVYQYSALLARLQGLKTPPASTP